MAGQLKYRRVLLKLSGEILAGDRGFGMDPSVMANLADQVRSVCDLGVELGIVIGAGNIFRGSEASALGVDRVSGDYMGMLGTAINALALQNVLEQRDIETRVLSAIEMREISEPYIKRRATRHLERNRVVVFSCGTGNPFFTTDTAASLRATEIGADLLIKGTKVDAVYDSDPEKNPNAKPYRTLSFMDVLRNQLKVMDAAAISLCMDNNLPIVVFNIGVAGNLKRVVSGEEIGTFISADGTGRDNRAVEDAGVHEHVHE